MLNNQFTPQEQKAWETMIKNLQLKHMLNLTVFYTEEWRRAVQDKENWQPDIRPFRSRLTLAMQLMLKAQRPKWVARAIEEVNHCDAMRCMMQGCAEGRSRPFVHHMKWWKNHTDGDHEKIFFPTAWDIIGPLLKNTYRSELWKKRIKENGFYLCWPHYAQYFKKCCPSHQGILPKHEYYRK